MSRLHLSMPSPSAPQFGWYTDTNLNPPTTIATTLSPNPFCCPPSTHFSSASPLNITPAFFPWISATLSSYSPNQTTPSSSALSSVKVALDGGTRPGDTFQILPLALAQPPNPRSITSHSVLRGHPSLTHRVGFFRGIQWGIHSQKIIIGTAICFFLRKYAFQMKNIKHTHYISSI